MKRILLFVMLIAMLLSVLACGPPRKEKNAAATSSTTTTTAVIPTTYSELPPGLTLNTQGTITGTPTGSPGVYDFTVTVTDAEPTPQTATKALSINVYQEGDVAQDVAPVNVLDLILVAQAVGETGTPGWIPEDIADNGTISVLDLIDVGEHFGE